MWSFLKILLRGAALAVLILAVFLFSVEALDRAFIRPYSGHCKSVRKLIQKAGRIEILFLGQSDMHDAILEEAFAAPAFNFAWAGENLIGTYHKLKAYIDDLPRLKLIVLALPLCSFTSSRSNAIRLHHYMLYITPRDLARLYRLKGGVVVKQKMESLVSFLDWEYMRLTRERLNKAWEEHRDLAKGTLVHKNPRAIRSDTRPWDPKRDARKRVDLYFAGEDPFDAHLLVYFQEILRLAWARRIPVITLTCPVTAEYHQETARYLTDEDFKQRVVLDPACAALIYRHLDYQSLFADQHEYFKNSNHLTPEGADRFSRRVAEDLSPMLNAMPVTAWAGPPGERP